MATHARLLALALGLAFARPATANSDPLSGFAASDSLAIGAVTRIEASPYVGAGTRFDFTPLYIYEGERFYLRSPSVGLKFGPETRRFEVFLRHRFEGTPTDDIPDSLAGMAPREQGIDAGVSGQLGGAWGLAFVELLHDVSHASGGAELRLGYQYPVRRGRLWLRPHVMLSLRDGDLNNYYYGVRPDEARPDRPAYVVQSGLQPEVGVYAAYLLTTRLRLFAGATVARLPDTVTGSPIVGERLLRQVTLGAAYDLSSDREVWPERRPFIARALYGNSSDCDVLQIALFRCTTTHTQDDTSIAGVEIGRPFVDRVNGWPLDVAGFVGITQHKERGLQADFPEIRAYFKFYFYGFPWDAKLRTRLGLGVGLSYAKEIPVTEQQSQASQGEATSRLLNILDPTADFSVGDLIAVRALRETYLGVGVSHRSGIFGSSQLLGNVSGGSNYIYGYVETSF
jgi:outer membrane protein